MRDADRREVEGFTGATTYRAVEDVLRSSVEGSYAVATAERGGKPLAIFGTSAISLLSGEGCLWMLGTPEVYKVPGVLTRLAKQHIVEVGGVFPHLSNFVDVQNRHSLKWLRWMGATIHEAEPAGLYGWPFHRFEIGIDDVR